MAEKIGSSSFSHEWLLATLKEVDPAHFGDVSTVRDVKEISGGKGFASKVYLCSLGTTEVVLKVPEAGKLEEVCGSADLDGSKPEVPSICLMHDREAAFYEDYGSLELIQLPRIYRAGRFGPEAKQQGFLLMQSLKGDHGDLVEGFTRAQLLSMARDLARFQAHFLRLKDDSWVSRFHKEVAPATIQLMTGLLEKLRAVDEGRFGTGVDRLMPYVKSKEFVDWTYYFGYKELGLPAVMVHGNLWTNNIFWREAEDGSLGSEVAAYIDWQLSHAGCLTSDLSSVLVLCTEPDVRRMHTDEILKEYYCTLSKELNGAVPFPFSKVQELYDINLHSQCWNLMFAVAFHPAMVAQLPKNVQEAKIVRLHLRCKFAMEDCIVLLDSLPEKFASLSVKE